METQMVPLIFVKSTNVLQYVKMLIELNIVHLIMLNLIVNVHILLHHVKVVGTVLIFSLLLKNSWLLLIPMVMDKLMLVTKSEKITQLFSQPVIKMETVASVTGKLGNVLFKLKTNGELKLVQMLNHSSVITHTITMSVTVKDIGLVLLSLNSLLNFSMTLTLMIMKFLITSMESILYTQKCSRILVILMVMV